MKVISIILLFNYSHAWIYKRSIIQNIIASIITTTTPVNNYLHEIQNNVQNIHIPIEHKLNIAYISYTTRQLFYKNLISTDYIIKLLTNIEWTEIDILNTFVFISALYTITNDIKVKKSIDKVVENGIVTKNSIKNIKMCFLIIVTVLFRDVENANGIQENNDL